MEPVYVLDENEQVYTKDFIVDKIRKHLREVEELKGSGNKSKKAAIVVEIFRFLSKYQVIRDFINVQKKFKETTISKAYEFLKETEFPEVVDICTRFLEKMGYAQNRVE
jgi:hypothetical protein